MPGSEIRILADENVPVAVIQRLRALGIDANSVVETDYRGIDDESLLKLCGDEELTLLTADKKDFFRLHEEMDHAGIIIVTKRMQIGRILSEVMKVVDSLSREDIANRVQTIPWR